MDEKQLNHELSNLYGASWVYASYYLLLKSESREDDAGTNYFYKGGREAALLYDMVGWDFERKDRELKAWFGRERQRRISAKDQEGYEAVEVSEKLYDLEKELAFKSSRLGRYLGDEAYKDRIRKLILSEEKTPWFEAHKSLSAEKDAMRRVMAERLHVHENDIMPLDSLEDKHKGVFVSVALGPEAETEPARFLGTEERDGQTVYLLEHLREIGTAWSGPNGVFKNMWDNASHDGCLEVVIVPADKASGLQVGLNPEGSFLRGRMEGRCAVSDMGRRMRDNLLSRPYSMVKGKPVVGYDKVLARYVARKERYVPFRVEADAKRLDAAKEEILKEQDASVKEIKTLGGTGMERLDTMLQDAIRRQRESIMLRFRQFRRARPEQGEAGRIKNPVVRNRDVSLSPDREADARNRRPKEL